MSDVEQLTQENAELQEAKDALEAQLADALKKLSEAETAPAEHEAELVSRLREAEDRASKAEAEAEELRPTKDVSKFFLNTKEDVVERFGEQAIKDLAHSEWALLNKERVKAGHYPLEPLKDEQLEDAMDRAIAELLTDQARAEAQIPGPPVALNRTLKMVSPAGHLVQIPYEPQVNNMAGSLADGYERYRQKGFKMTNPMLCATQDCNQFSAIGADGNFLYRAYCSADHETRTERDSVQAAVPGITTRNVVSV